MSPMMRLIKTWPISLSAFFFSVNNGTYLTGALTTAAGKPFMKDGRE